MLDSLSDRLTAALRKPTGRRRLRPEDIDASLREVRMALLEADVHYKGVQDFQERSRVRRAGAELEKALNPAPQAACTSSRSYSKSSGTSSSRCGSPRRCWWRTP